ncbi:flagellar hook-basal body complex protein FliE [Mediterraneibacter sp. NSJ-55]|uniref:Flagellar hook-basal body complex protein FliE n=1 Tax=Mediterraneibacter hominis TaxID=2763054 RepID=A0A923LIC0_9FIRM|nr:flagellar hook-basal body complex protein FliE [Mediterraneibacter hominis]MBC5689332.1 flagellar hook-basal body complex protein FliE [Mediterraneibacter hominis]
MENGFITPIRAWGSMSDISGAGEAEKKGGQSQLFQNIFYNAVQDVRSTEQNLQKQQYLLATGQTDDPHTLQIAASEAQLATNMLVQLRNKALDSYNELMRISL